MGSSKTASALRIETKDPEILVVLQTSLFRVPRFQRSYVWQTEQVIDFAQDLWDEGPTPAAIDVGLVESKPSHLLFSRRVVQPLTSWPLSSTGHAH